LYLRNNTKIQLYDTQNSYIIILLSIILSIADVTISRYQSTHMSHNIAHTHTRRRHSTKCINNLNAASSDRVNGWPVVPQPLTNSRVGRLDGLDHCTTVQCGGLPACSAHSYLRQMQTALIIQLVTVINPVKRPCLSNYR